MLKKIILFILLCFPIFQLCAQEKFTLVIDAGHGGHDPGCIGASQKEKDLTLRHAMAFGRLVEKNCTDVKVIYTRTTDKFLELWQRAEVANKNKADLFISIHINSLPAGRIARGFQTYTLGSGRNSGTRGILQNLEVAKRENAVIELEKDYKQIYRGFDPNSVESNIMFEILQDKNMERSVELAKMMQRNVCASTGRQDMGVHQDNLAVLRLTSMPACLLELGFISTPDEETFMASDDALSRYARGIYNAFVEYKNKYDIIGRRAIKLEIPKPSAETSSSETKVAEQTAKASTSAAQSAAKTSQKPSQSVSQQSSSKVQQSSAATQSTALDETKPIFKVQIAATSKPLPANADMLKGLSDVGNFTENNFIKYTVGASNDYNKIAQLRKQLVDRFPQAFIVAFLNGQKIEINEAIRIYKANKK